MLVVNTGNPVSATLIAVKTRLLSLGDEVSFLKITQPFFARQRADYRIIVKGEMKMVETILMNSSVLSDFANLFSNVLNIEWRMVLMWAVGGILIFLAIKKQMEPTLLLPMGFGTILVNLPMSGAITQDAEAVLKGLESNGPLTELFNAGIANELFPLLLFIGIGAMIDFGPLLKNPWLMLFGAAAQFGIFFKIGRAHV